MIKALSNLFKTLPGEISTFLDDKNISSCDADLLDLGAKASAFATGVLNKGSSTSLVFGIDAPWGVGKPALLNYVANNGEI